MAYISTPEVKEIRKALKIEFGKDVKFSVVRAPSGLAVDVSIMSSKHDMSQMWQTKEPGQYGYGYQQTHSAKSMPNQEACDMFNKIVEIIQTAPAKAEQGSEWYDKSDSQSDYFDTAFYYHVNVGKFDKPYVQQ